jgi:hypothetical protein
MVHSCNQKVIDDLEVKLRVAEEKLEKTREGLKEIIKGMGRYSQDQFEHARNTIEDMKELARQTLAQIGEKL